jgi:PAS domain S-box-containing protein
MGRRVSADHEGLQAWLDGSEMGSRIRGFDWSKTPLGPVESWSPALRMMTRFLLANRFPLLLWWGPSYIQIYNDAYRPIPGAKHPGALGQPASECWSEVWHVIGPLIDTPFHGGPATWMEDIQLELHRHGFLEETHFTIAYSPVPDETAPRGIGGVLATVHEITEKVVSERRMAALRDLGSRGTAAKTVEDACALAAKTLAAHDKDVPFALLYLADADGRRARLAGAAGVPPGEDISPPVIDLDDAGAGGWPLAEAKRTASLQVVPRLGERFARIPPGPWSDPPDTAVVIPLPSSKAREPLGFLVAGVSARRKLDDAYRGFFELATAQIAGAVAGARAYEEERRRAEELAELDRAKTTFFSNVSHELRTPLTLLLGPLEDALRDPAERWQRERLEMIHRGGLRLKKLVNTLLDFSRIEAGRVEARYEPTHLAALTADLASNFRAACDRAGLRFVVDCRPLPRLAYVDRDMWEKIVLNLLSNAFKFTLEGEIAVHLVEEGGMAKLSVRDTGAGIAAEQLPRVFERFHRIEGVRARTNEGTGIGLALVQELVRLHGGAVVVESVLGRGTTFTVTIPLGSAHLPPSRLGKATMLSGSSIGANAFVEEAMRWLPEDGEAPPADEKEAPAPISEDPRPASDAPPEAPRAARSRILVADDNADMRKYIRGLLAARHEVIAVGDGEQALAAVRRRRPDLVVTDVMMPKLDGFGLIRALRADPATASIPVIVLSARAGEEATIEGIEAGADDYLVKPFSARELLARVQGQLELTRARLSIAASEERFHALADAMPQIVYVSGPTGAMEFINRQWQDYTGLPTAGPDDLARAVHPDDLGAMHRAWSASLAAGRPFAAEIRMRRASDGAYRWFLSRAVPIREGDGRVARWFGTSTDIDDQKRLEEALRDQDRRKDEFLATLAHELRNPLAPVRTGLQILKGARSEEAAEKARAMMDRQITHMVRLIDDLLDVSRVSRGRVDLKREIVDVRTVIDAALEVSRPLVEAGRHALSVSIPAEPLPLDVDATRMAQVVSNLLNNAAKYTPAGGRIDLSAERDGDGAVLRVRDDGIGIPEEMLPKVFDLFTQVEPSRDRAQGGLGIGLSLVKKLVELHGGTVTGESAGVGRGSTFTVRLPLPAAGPRLGNKAAPEPDGVAPRGAGLRVLVVDDNVDGAESLSLLLSMRDHETAVAHSGPEALDVARRFHPEVVFLDIGLPGMSGYEVAQQLRREALPRPAVLIALTGWGSDEDKRRAMAAGFDFHLIKPVNVTTVDRILSQARATPPAAIEGAR